VAAVVILYRPDESTVRNILSYSSQVATVLAIDNSEEPDQALVERVRSIPNVSYHPIGTNVGIATALNTGIEMAQGAGYRWVLTMDQDSTAEPDMVGRMVAYLEADSGSQPIALVAPEHLQVGGKPQRRPGGLVPILTTMTSGNLLSVEAWRETGKFMDELFIDQVDNEFCLRLSRAGYRIVVAGGAVLHHRVGALQRHLFPIPAYTSNHSALRKYYITRNRLLVGRMYWSDYPQYGRFELAQAIKEIVKIVLYESHKRLKLRMIWRGYTDFRHSILGPYQERR